MREWTSRHDYLTRVHNLTDGSGGGRLNDDFYLVVGQTIHEDGAHDELLGGNGLDWFFFDPDEDQGVLQEGEVLGNQLP